MYTPKLTLFRLSHCPPGQFKRAGNGMNAGFDLMAAEDKIIYPPYIIREDETLNLCEWVLLGKLDDLNPSIQKQVNDVLELGINDNKLGFKIDDEGNVYQVHYKPQLVSTGIVIKYSMLSWSLVTTRSSVGGKQLLSMPHGVGIIDYPYSGPNDEVFLSFTSDTLRIIKRGDRVAQLVPMPQYGVEFEEGNALEESFMELPSRGGFGSTGLN